MLFEINHLTMQGLIKSKQASLGEMALLIIFFLSALLATTHAVEYHATNNVVGTPGGNRFEAEIGIQYSVQTLKSASEFIWQTFRQGEGDRKNVQSVSMFVDSFDQYVAYAINNEIHVSASYIAGYQGDVKSEITGVLYHEATHIWQWNANGQAPSHVIEGIADFVRLKAGYAPSHWVKAGGGNRWDQGYDVTAHFFDYCNGLKDGFVAELNGRLRSGAFSDGLFVELLGKSVDQLWSDYKAKYSG